MQFFEFAACGDPTLAEDLAQVGFDGPWAEEQLCADLTGGYSVTVSGQRVTFAHGPGRAGIRYSSRLVDGHQHVVPTGAASLLRQGRLD